MTTDREESPLECFIAAATYLPCIALAFALFVRSANAAAVGSTQKKLKLAFFGCIAVSFSIRCAW